jgi:hypothetical protein
MVLIFGITLDCFQLCTIYLEIIMKSVKNEMLMMVVAIVISIQAGLMYVSTLIN